MKILIGSRNLGKTREFKSILSQPSIDLVTPHDINLDDDFDVEETGTTFKDNAILKAKAFAQKSNFPSISDDSGLQVDALNGRPGVYSKRYGQDDYHRCQKILSELHNSPNNQRTARFVCVVAFHDPKSNQTFSTKGIIEGKISTQLLGSDGFGYDPIFIPTEGDGRTFAQLGQDFKNQTSHRARALQQIKPLIQQHFSQF